MGNYSELKENMRKLDNCPGHKFPEFRNGVYTHYRCERCGGVISSLERRWYEIGFQEGVVSMTISTITGKKL